MEPQDYKLTEYIFKGNVENVILPFEVVICVCVGLYCMMMNH